MKKERSADDLEIRLRADHMQRLANKQCDTEAGIVFLDALVGSERFPITQEILRKKRFRQVINKNLFRLHGSESCGAAVFFIVY